MTSVQLSRLAAMAFLAAAPIAAFAQSAAVPQREVELPAEKGLIVGHQARQGRSVLVELIPIGETVERYTRMVTLQTMPDFGRVPEKDVIDRFTERYRAGCPRATSAALPFQSPSDGTRIDCPLHPVTKRMETVFVRLLDMAPDRAMVQITMTQVPMPDDSRWARDYLSRVAVR
jgi:hypothetical protein